jgi:hypothetical protein
MPSIEPPEPIPRGRKLEAHEIRDQYIAYEGLGFCVYEYIPVEKIADKQLVKLWKAARLALQDVVEYLETVPSKPQSTRRPMRRLGG